MGLATITQNIGEGLYKVWLDYDISKLDAEIARLEEDQTRYFSLLNKALDTLKDARRATGEANEAVSAVIEQWKNALITATQQNPPQLPPPVLNDPETGEPWVDPDRAQDTPLFDAINAARTTAGAPALSRVSEIDYAVRAQLRNIAATGSVSKLDGNQDAGGRLWAFGYGYDAVVGARELLALGAVSPDDAVAQWLRLPENRAILLDDDYTDAGVAYLYAPESAYSHLWGAIFTAPGSLPTETEPEPDPAKDAANNAEGQLKKIEIPTVDTFQPSKLGEAAAALAKAAGVEKAADKAVEKLKIEYLERERRIVKLTALKAASEAEIHVWACRWWTDIPVGTQVQTAEVPGYYIDADILKTTTMGQRDDPTGTIPDTTVPYYERSFNIIKTTADTGRLRHSEVMTDAEVFINLALEPGTLKWKPVWRYGVITARSGNYCALTLNSTESRGGDELSALPIDDVATLTNVPISYPPCNGAIFQAGDEVLVAFDGYDRDSPRVIGFRREPRPCLDGQISWEQTV